MLPLNNKSKSIEYYQHALRIQPEWAEIYNNLGVTFFRKNLIEQVIKSLEKALQLKPGYIQAKNNLDRVIYAQSNGP